MHILSFYLHEWLKSRVPLQHPIIIGVILSSYFQKFFAETFKILAPKSFSRRPFHQPPCHSWKIDEWRDFLLVIFRECSVSWLCSLIDYPDIPLRHFCFFRGRSVKLTFSKKKSLKVTSQYFDPKIVPNQWINGWKNDNHGTMMMMMNNYNNKRDKKRNNYQLTTNWMKVAPFTNVQWVPWRVWYLDTYNFNSQAYKVIFLIVTLIIFWFFWFTIQLFLSSNLGGIPDYL